MSQFISISYDVGQGKGGHTELQKIEFAFDRAGQAVKSFGKYVFPELISIFEQEVDANFDSQAGGMSGPWAPLSVKYAELKAKTHPGKGILQRSGNLRDGLTKSSSAFALRFFDDNTFSYGTKGLAYASFHQTGTSKMTARPFVDFGESSQKKIQKAAQVGLIKAIRAADKDNALKVKE